MANPVNSVICPGKFPHDFCEDLNRKIFSYLDIQDLANVSCVNRACRELGSDERLWENQCPEIKTPDGMSLKRHLSQHGVLTENKLIERVREFVKKVQINQIGVYECQFPLNNNAYSCKIVIGSGKFESRRPVVQRDIFAKKIDEPLNLLRADERLIFTEQFSAILPENTFREIKNIFHNRVERLQNIHNMIECPFFHSDNQMNILSNSIPALMNWRMSQEGFVKKLGAKAVTLVGLTSIGVFTLAEGVTSLSLAAVASSARLYSKENQWGNMLYKRGMMAIGLSLGYTPVAFTQLVVDR
ncbi:MAG: F-box-like domain-containing protein [Waddliaceae bacterium]